MGFVIGTITAIAGLFWALNSLQRSGFNLGALNPFAWFRRRAWQQRYGENPLYCLADPMDVAAVLLLGVARCDGEVSAQQKNEILAIFQDRFHLDHDAASDLLRAGSHLIRNEVYIVDNVRRILAPAMGAFSSEQIASLLNLMGQVAACDGAINAEQQKLIDTVLAAFNETAKGTRRW